MRAPRELMLWVEVISVLQFRLRLASSTGSAKIVRPSLRMPALVPPFTSSGCDTWYFPLISLSVRELLRQSGVYPKLPDQKPISGHRASILSRMNAASSIALSTKYPSPYSVCSGPCRSASGQPKSLRQTEWRLSFLGHWNPRSLKLSRIQTGIRLYLLFQISQNCLTIRGRRTSG